MAIQTEAMALGVMLDVPHEPTKALDIARRIDRAERRWLIWLALVRAGHCRTMLPSAIDLDDLTRAADAGVDVRALLS